MSDISDCKAEFHHGRCFYCGQPIPFEQMVCDDCCKEYNIGC